LLALGLVARTPAADPPKADAEQIAKLIKQLSSDDFTVREKATKELEAIGTPALEALREATKSDDTEVKYRAKAILEKVEKKAIAEKVLAPTKVKLSFKDTPLADAVAEFNKQSGYTITVHDPESKLKDRKVTLDTGEVTFWEAFDRFCEKAGVVEATWQDVMRPIPALPPGGGPGGGILPPPPPIVPPKDFKADPPAEKKEDGGKADPPKADPPPAAARQVPPPPAGGGGPPPGGRVMRGLGGPGFLSGDIVVVDGKPKAVPTCYSGSVRIRALKEGPNFGLAVPAFPAPGGGPAAKEDAYTVWLEVRAEPKVQLQSVQSVAVAKATDDQDQKLDKADPAAPAAPGGGAPPAAVLRPLPPVGLGGFGGMPGFGGTQHFPVPLKKGEKEAKALKEFAGTLSAGVLTPAEPVITVEKITKAAGETAKGKDGGQIKVTEVKEEDGKITIKFELEAPQNAGGFVLPGGPAPPVLPAPPPLPVKPAGGGFGLQVGGAPPAPPAAAPARVGFVAAPGISLVDDKGKTIPQTGGAPPKLEFVPGAGPKVEYTQEYKLEKDQKPAKLVYSAGRLVTVDIPFSFKDVPLK
jgi:hypothetical protein